MPVPRIFPVVDNIYQTAVLLYPPDFRREFASEMTRDFRLATNEAWLEGAWRHVFSVWLHVSADFARTLILQWLRSEWAAITLIQATFTLAGLAGISVAVQVLAGRPVAPSAPHPDRDLLMLMVLVTVVLLLIAATIILTLWFTRPLRNRTRL